MNRTHKKSTSLILMINTAALALGVCVCLLISCCTGRVDNHKTESPYEGREIHGAELFTGNEVVDGYIPNINERTVMDTLLYEVLTCIRTAHDVDDIENALFYVKIHMAFDSVYNDEEEDIPDEIIASEIERLHDLGYDVEYNKDNGICGYLTKDQLLNFPVSSEYDDLKYRIGLAELYA